ncbi:MAG: hypothetical protein CL471_18150 [Acidobacteria bacterium]|nr:hypothetical protein [Acidobacteriota bacterium]|tara:strand:+ start:222 stop:698 length:477 start_codon:yes stop_codon:yes gene_type:complete
MVDNLDKKLDGVLERLHYIELVIRNLKDREGTLITDVEEIDERLFREIANYEMLTEELKRDFLMLLMEDAERMVASCIGNINNFDKISGEFSRMEKLLDFIGDHEDEDVRKSRELQKLALEAKRRLKDIRENMNNEVEKKQKEKKEYERVQDIHRKMK